MYAERAAEDERKGMLSGGGGAGLQAQRPVMVGRAPSYFYAGALLLG
eukprot:SAG22_NODE_18853_length_280_cov_1.408840_1_plen_46_part_01